jgi:plasmid stabilization system protein ParE
MNLEMIPQAQQDTRDAADYYRAQRAGLDKEFLIANDEAVERIAANPILFERIRSNIRRCLVDRFPYGVYFRMPNKDTIRIIVAWHHSRHPGYGMRRK